MKKIILAAIICASTISAGCGLAEEKIYPYPFNSARIEYASPTDEAAKTVVTIKGDKELFQTKGKSNTLMIINKEKIYYINLDSKTGTMAQNQTYAELKKLPKADRINYLMGVTIGLKETKNGMDLPAATGKKQIAGQTCDEYVSNTVGKVCLWNALPLEINSEAMGGGTLSAVANKVEVNIDVPDSVFDLPSGIEIKDLSA